MDYLTLARVFLPDWPILLAVFVALGADYAKFRNADILTRSRLSADVLFTGLVFSMVGLLMQAFLREDTVSEIFPLANVPYVIMVKGVLNILAVGTLFFSRSRPVTEHVSEYYALIGLGLLAMNMLVMTYDLLIIFLALETLSITLYALVFLRRGTPGAAEAALKYFAFGGVSSALLLLGIAFLYGAAGTFDIRSIFVAIANGENAQPLPLAVAGLLLVIGGLGFKLAAAPFHFWAPDVYQSAPTPISGWIASASKIASVLVLISIARVSLGFDYLRFAPLLGVIALTSLTVGNLGALRQSNVKRLLAYSGIGHAGYMLIGLCAGSGPQSLLLVYYYVIGYAVATLGAFGAITVLEKRVGGEGDLADLAGAWRHSPIVCALFGIFLLSLAGVPPLAGFTGKFFLFFGALRNFDFSWSNPLYLLVFIALGFSSVALYYYLKVLKVLLLPKESASVPECRAQAVDYVYLGFLGVATILLGLFPSYVFRLFVGS